MKADQMNRIFLAVILAASVSACERPDQIGNVPITLSPQLQTEFEEYKTKGTPGYFAVAEDGSAVGSLYCRNTRCKPGTAEEAIDSCEKATSGAPCKIFARGSKIIWQGEITYR